MIKINNLTSRKINENFLKKVAKIVLKGENREKENISVVLIGPKKIKELNNKYRKKNKPTDVLSFAEGLNEILICPSEVLKNAKEFGNSFKKEMGKILIHGILHLFGYDHEISEKEAERMRNKEEYYLSRLRIFK